MKRNFLSLSAAFFLVIGFAQISLGLEPVGREQLQTYEVHIPLLGDDGVVKVNFLTPRSPEEFRTVIDADTVAKGSDVLILGPDNALATSVAEELKREGVAADHIETVPFEDPDAIKAPPQPRTFKDMFIKSTQSELVLGSITAWVGTAVSYHATFTLLHQQGPRAWAYVIASTILSALTGIATQSTMDNLFSANYSNFGQKVGARIQLMRRAGQDIAVKEMLRILSGAYGPIHSAFSAQGQIEVFKNFLTFTVGGSLFGMTRSQIFQGERKFVNPIASFDLGLLTTILGMLAINQITGPVLAKVTLWHSTLSFTTLDAVVLGTYLSSTLIIKTATDWYVRIAQKQDAFLKKIPRAKDRATTESSEGCVTIMEKFAVEKKISGD